MTTAAYYAKNRDKIREKAKAYREQNLEHVNARGRAWYAANKERVLAQQKKYKQEKKLREAEVLLAAAEVVADSSRKQLKEPKNVSNLRKRRVDQTVEVVIHKDKDHSRRVSKHTSNSQHSASSFVLSRRAEAARRICIEEAIEAESVRSVVVEINGVRFTYM